MQVIQATLKHRAAIIELLKAENLPVKDLPAELDHFFVAIQNGQIIGAIGLEVYSPYGLLRSMVVHRDYRNNRIATTLVEALESYATSLHINQLYLLTETAVDYFSKKNYLQVNRAEVPDAIKQTTEFTSVCPVSAVVMLKAITNECQ